MNIKSTIMKRTIYFLSIITFIVTASCMQQPSNRDFVHPEPATIDSNVVLPPAWSFGVLYGGYTNQQETIDRIKKIQAHDYPIDAYWIDSWFWDYQNHGMGPDKYMDFVGDTVSFPNRENMWSFMENNNIKGGFWVWDCILKKGNEEVFKEFKEKGHFSRTHMYTGSWHNSSTTTARYKREEGHKGTMLGEIDFEDPQTVSYFKDRMKHFFDEGADFIKLDRNSNVSDCRVMFEMTQELGGETEGRGFILSHKGGIDDPEFKKYPTKWTGDTRGDWTVEDPTKDFHSWMPEVALKENIALYTDPSRQTSKIPFLTNDMGGFDIGNSNTKDEELYIRWMQFSFFGPVTEVFSQASNPTSNLAWKYSGRADDLFKRYAHLRMRLFPYIYSYAHQSRLRGEHMIGKFPDHIYQYMFGDEMLIAPVYKKGATKRKVHLPKGDWINFWTREKVSGNQSIETEAPIYQIPVFIREGAIIPMRNYASSIEAGSNQVLHIHIYPGADHQFTLIEDDGSSNDYLEGIYAKTTMKLTNGEQSSQLLIEPTKGYYDQMKEERTWIFHIYDEKDIDTITVNGEDMDYKENGKMTTTGKYTNNKYEPTEVRITY